jgi:hypothetical protein
MDGLEPGRGTFGHRRLGGSWTAKALLAAKAEGAVIRVSMPDDENHGKQVVHDPEKARDITPWRLVKGEARFKSADCRPEGLHGGSWALARRLRINVR